MRRLNVTPESIEASTSSFIWAIFYCLLFSSSCIAISLIACDTALAQSDHLKPEHLKAKYVPWGIDEYELFGLTRSDLQRKFKGQLDFNQDCTRAKLAGQYPTPGPHFLLTHTNDKVSTVQRLFIDGAGCNIKGPLFKGKKHALQFSINGLSSLQRPLSSVEKSRLQSAQQQLQKAETPAAIR